MASRLSSPAICHSNPRQISVGRSTTNLPGLTASTAPSVDADRRRRKEKRFDESRMTVAYHRETPCAHVAVADGCITVFGTWMSNGNQLPPAGETACPTLLPTPND